MKYVKVTYEDRVSQDESRDREMLIQGDRRQTPEEMIHLAFRDVFGPDTTVETRADTYAHPSGRSARVKEWRLLSADDVDEARGQLFTKIVNRNVTEKYCPQSYSGSPPS